MKLSLNLKSFSLGDLLKKKLGTALWLFLLVVVCAEGLIIYREVSKVSQVQSDPNVVQSQIVRVNLEQHDKLEDQLDKNLLFEPRLIPGGNSFGIAPTSASSGR